MRSTVPFSQCVTFILINDYRSENVKVFGGRFLTYPQTSTFFLFLFFFNYFYIPRIKDGLSNLHNPRLGLHYAQ